MSSQWKSSASRWSRRLMDQITNWINSRIMAAAWGGLKIYLGIYFVYSHLGKWLRKSNIMWTVNHWHRLLVPREADGQIKNCYNQEGDTSQNLPLRAPSTKHWIYFYQSQWKRLFPTPRNPSHLHHSIIFKYKRQLCKHIAWIFWIWYFSALVCFSGINICAY